MTMMRAFALLPLLLLGAAPAAPSAPAPVLSLPIACTPGRDCFVQQYVDHDPGPGAVDYHCGGLAYDGHDGTDIRLPTRAAQRRGVAVLAAAPGTVTAIRDGEPDHSIETDADRAAVKGRECGNGVVIDHVGGWSTQYCHMAKGSVAVRRGQAVAAGDRLGLVGLSGDTQFPHVHLTVRQDGHAVDPFAPGPVPGACSQRAGRTLWSPAAAAALGYADTRILNAGFADAAVDMDAIEEERTGTPGALTPLVFYGRVIGMTAGDRVVVRITGPDGQEVAVNSATVDRTKAQYLLFAGRKRPVTGWPAGRYQGSIMVVRGDRTIASREARLTL